MDRTSTEEVVDPVAGSGDEARAAVAAALEYTGEDRGTEEMIVAALLRLPEDVRTFATERCRFVTAGDRPHAGSAIPSDRWLVELPDGLDEASLAHEVANAVAHAWLSHDVDHQDEPDEAQVRKLVAGWEFTGPGADA